MNNYPISPLFRRPVARPRSIIGVVLPVVLVVLTVLTGLVVTQIRRGAIDERLAANTRETVQLDSAVQTVLRWCEARVISAPLDTVNVAPGTVTPAWRTAAHWATNNESLDFSGATGLPGINTNPPPSCVVEEATCELAPPISPTGQVTTGCNGIDPRWRKFRITARVSVPVAELLGNRFMFAQSELRLFVD